MILSLLNDVAVQGATNSLAQSLIVSDDYYTGSGQSSTCILCKADLQIALIMPSSINRRQGIK